MSIIDKEEKIMQRTTNYGLCQYEGSDKTSYLVNYNEDMLKIDTAIKNAADGASAASTAAGQAQSTADGAAQGVTTLNTQINGATGLAADVSTLQGSVGSISSLIGDGHPTTSNQTIIGAINGLEGAVAPREDGDNLANSYVIGGQFARGGSVYTALTPLTAGTAFASLTLNTDYKVSDTLVEQINDADDKVDAAETVLSDESVTGFTINRVGKVVVCGIFLNDQTFAFGDVIGVIPEGYRPTFGVKTMETVGGHALTANTNGNVTTDAAITSANVRATFTWITNDAVPQ